MSLGDALEAETPKNIELRAALERTQRQLAQAKQRSNRLSEVLIQAAHDAVAGKHRCLAAHPQPQPPASRTHRRVRAPTRGNPRHFLLRPTPIAN